MSIQSRQEAFMKLMGQEIGSISESLDENVKLPQDAVLYAELIEEEAGELIEAFESFIDTTYEDEAQAALANLAKECADLLVVLVGFCCALGIPLERIYNEVQDSNMRKAVRQPDGSFKITKREDGKVLKPEGWQAPNIQQILDLQLIQEQNI